MRKEGKDGMSWAKSAKEKAGDKVRSKKFNDNRKKLCEKEGLCFTCLEPNDNYTQRCSKCTAKRKETRDTKGEQARKKERRYNLAEQHICVECGDTNPKDTQLCAACTQKAVGGRNVELNNATTRKRNATRVEQGICIQCMGKNDTDAQRCDTCSSKQNERHQKRRGKRIRSGVCIKCTQINDNENYAECSRCRATSKEYRRVRKEADILNHRCVECHSGLTNEYGNYCLRCWCRDRAWSLLGGSDHWTEIRNLFEKQDWKCAYSGQPLIIGKNASIDHIVPLARGGANAIENLQLVILKVNEAKRDLMHDEFVEMCRQVTENLATK